MNRDHLLLPLTLAAGCVDASAFLLTDVFPANMTGNTVLLGLALAHANVQDGSMAAMVLVAFCLGAAAAAWALRKSPTGWSRRVAGVLLFSGGILLAGAIAGMLGLSMEWLALLTAFTMGMQAAAVAQVGVAGVSTVVVTSTLTSVIRRWIRARPVESRAAGVQLPLATWSAYFLGALCGGMLVRFAASSAAALASGILILATAFVVGWKSEAN